MAELAPAEMYAAGQGGARTLQAWRTLLNWFRFVFQIFFQFVKGTRPVAQVLSYVGFRHPLLSSSLAFKPLPVDHPTDTPPPPQAIALLEKLTESIGAVKASVDVRFDFPLLIVVLLFSFPKQKYQEEIGTVDVVPLLVMIGGFVMRIMIGTFLLRSDGANSNYSSSLLYEILQTTKKKRMKKR